MNLLLPKGQRCVYWYLSVYKQKLIICYFFTKIDCKHNKWHGWIKQVINQNEKNHPNCCTESEIKRVPSAIGHGHWTYHFLIVTCNSTWYSPFKLTYWSFPCYLRPLLLFFRYLCFLIKLRLSSDFSKLSPNSIRPGRRLNAGSR